MQMPTNYCSNIEGTLIDTSFGIQPNSHAEFWTKINPLCLWLSVCFLFYNGPLFGSHPGYNILGALFGFDMMFIDVNTNVCMNNNSQVTNETGKQEQWVKSTVDICPGNFQSWFYFRWMEWIVWFCKWSVFLQIKFSIFSLFLAIHVASIFGHIDIIDLLLEKHADVNATEFLNGQTPLHLAAQRGHQKLIVCMLYN